MARRQTIGGLRTDLAIVLRDVGSLVLMESGLITLSATLALAFGEWYVALAFLTAGGITAAAGAFVHRRFDAAPAPRIKHGMVIAAGGWFSVAVFGALPFLLSAYFVPPDVMATYVPATGTEGWEPIRVGSSTTLSSLAYFRSPLHALFESMSGWTGSGLTMAVHEPSLPRTVQWWRSLMQWVGGVGVIVLTVSILARPGSGSYALYRSETREEKIHPSVVSTVRTVWKIFLLYTVLSVFVLFLALLFSPSAYAGSLAPGEAFWQALNHAMTALSTGGFSVTDGSIGTYNSPLVETLLLPIMTLGAIAFPIHYGVLRNRDFGVLVSDLQTRWLFVLFAVGSTLLALQLGFTVGPAGFGEVVAVSSLGLSTGQVDAVRDAVFQFVSALSCTGFQSSPIGEWADGGKLLLSGAMVLGGAAGSTVGGIKIIRGYTVARGIGWQFSRVFLPASAIVTTRIGDRTLRREEMEREFSEAAIVSLLWVLLLVASSLLLVNVVPAEFGYADALFEVASAQGNVGLSTGITGPTMHPVAEGMFVLNMWVGRLEIIPILVFARSVLYGFDP
ncbi:TrkH family potassium uptake protein [Halomarina litorea]|uniref:TrkH family potassium uptake protein n=1 Tax=Halomarina litorea TaxID=2961595 RepID=UPI0020C285E1|nr:potassium transporter TrkG [Halomarina sp. BCD28]